MAIMIKGMEMPVAGQTILVVENWDGSIHARIEESFDNFHPVIEIPDHGRLIDADAFDARYVVRCADCKWMQYNMRGDGYLPEGVPEYECRHWCGEVDPTDFCSQGVET